MANSKLNAVNAVTHLYLEQPLLRLPLELNRQSLRTAQREIDSSQKKIIALLDGIISNSTRPLDLLNQDRLRENNVLWVQNKLDIILSRLQSLKRKLAGLNETCLKRCEKLEARINHIDELYRIPSLNDAQFDRWSRMRLNRLIVDYLLRAGYAASANRLIEEEGLELFVDRDTFHTVTTIENSLRKGDLNPALVWCDDNRQLLKKFSSNLEYLLRLQQFIEFLRAGQYNEAAAHGRKYLSTYHDVDFTIHTAGLLAFAFDNKSEPYKSLYLPNRYDYLADLFVSTHHEVLSLPVRSLLSIALSAGLSALKTPSCHSKHASQTKLSSSITGVSSHGAGSLSTCPICSTELNDLSKSLPYAHHSRSIVDPDLVVLPNGRIYSREMLSIINKKLNTPVGYVTDPEDRSSVFQASEVKKVYIS